jgi:hypothetical protein
MGKRTLIHCWWKCKLVQPLSVWSFLKKWKMELSFHPAITLLHIYLKECKSYYIWDTLTTMFMPALFTKAKIWNQPRCPSTSEWIKKMWCVYITEYYSAIKKNKVLSFAVIWMELKIIIISKISQTQKYNYCMLSFIYGI